LNFDGVEGHPDFWLFDANGKLIAVIDPTTTASTETDWKYPHMLKSAFYALALGCDLFCDWTFCIGFGGNILRHEAHWAHLDEVPVVNDGSTETWRERVVAAMARIKAVAASETVPEAIPPWDPVGSSERRGGPKKAERSEWLCAKYCRDSSCERNGLLRAQRKLEEVPL
jgi:hypothetical protein